MKRSVHYSNQVGRKPAVQTGFTIIEVLIVLAIAGLIMLIVFLAVPALNRNNRDTQRKRDISRVLAATNEIINANGGNANSLTTANLVAAVGTFAYYTPVTTGLATSYMPQVKPGTTTATNGESTDTFTVWTGATCVSGQATSTGATTRQIAITYKVESAGGTLLCLNN